MTTYDLRQALRDCYTRTGQNIVDAGLLHSATLTPDIEAPGATIPGAPTRYLASLTLYAPGLDDAGNIQLIAQIENRLLGLQAISRAHVHLLPALFPIL